MKYIKNKIGHYIQLEKKDWNGDWRGFCNEIKKLHGVVFNPPEHDEDNWWFIPQRFISEVRNLYSIYITRVISDNEADKAAGFVPIPKRPSGKFARKPLRF